EVASKVGPVPCAAALPDLRVPDYRVLATDKVLFVGHPIVAIVATDKYAARDAVDLISIDYEELPAALDVERAASGGAVIHEPFGNNIAYKLTSGEGDIDAAMKSADRIISQKMIHHRLAPIAMEPRGVLARYFPGEEELTVWSSTQIPHLLRTQLALMIGIPENKLRVITPEVGGGFGSKLNVYAEEALVGWISVQLGKPVKWIESRRENVQSTIHGRAQVGTVEVRSKNFPAANEFPFHTATGLEYDSGDYEAALNKALDLSGYRKLREEQKQARAEGRLIGIGLSSYVEICALGPSQAMPAGGWESATVRIEPTGTVTVMTGASPHGQGQETSFAQIAADELGVDLNDVTVIHGDTGIVQYGIGTFGSRATAVGGTAVFVAIQKLKEKAAKIAAHMMQCDVSQVIFEAGRYS